jgi:hypothetical protein
MTKAEYAQYVASIKSGNIMPPMAEVGIGQIASNAKGKRRKYSITIASIAALAY